eukprot:comp4784_c0_seq1/m.923 comp4784_c0_seq1/g.923  ORF comp4784_c0_seq1/g.923 comp4784_c0_seq1/m.923 type:complete len:577 (-) comp4784_c0_seq1:73-1803(-)
MFSTLRALRPVVRRVLQQQSKAPESIPGVRILRAAHTQAELAQNTHTSQQHQKSYHGSQPKRNWNPLFKQRDLDGERGQEYKRPSGQQMFNEIEHLGQYKEPRELLAAVETLFSIQAPWTRQRDYLVQSLYNCFDNLLANPHRRLITALEIEERARKIGWRLRENHYIMLVKIGCAAGDFATVAEILARMRDDELKPNVQVFNAMVEAYARLGDMPSAQAIVGAMRDAGVSPNAHTYVGLLEGCVGQKDPSMAERLFAEMVEEGIEPTRGTFNGVVQALASHESTFAQALDLYRKMRLHNHIPNTQTVSAVLSHCLSRGDIKTAREIIADCVRVDRIAREHIVRERARRAEEAAEIERRNAAEREGRKLASEQGEGGDKGEERTVETVKREVDYGLEEEISKEDSQIRTEVPYRVWTEAVGLGSRAFNLALEDRAAAEDLNGAIEIFNAMRKLGDMSDGSAEKSTKEMTFGEMADQLMKPPGRPNKDTFRILLGMCLGRPGMGLNGKGGTGGFLGTKGGFTNEKVETGMQVLKWMEELGIKKTPKLMDMEVQIKRMHALMGFVNANMAKAMQKRGF